MNSGFRHDFRKWFSYFARIATSKVEVEVGGEVITFEPPKIISISRLLYRSDNCHTNCYKCCYFNWNFWADCELRPSSFTNLIIIRNRSRLFSSEHHNKGACPHLTEDGCAIHNINPIHCRLPLMKFKQVKSKTYITKEEYGRNWQFGCPIKFGPYDQNAFNEDMNRLTRVKKVAEYFEIPTAIDIIIDMVNRKQSGIVWTYKPIYQLNLT